MLFKKGDILQKIGQNDGALYYYQLSLDVDNRNPELWFIKGELHEKMDNFLLALECYNKAVELSRPGSIKYKKARDEIEQKMRSVRSLKN